jgi:hypothetical protein
MILRLQYCNFLSISFAISSLRLLCTSATQIIMSAPFKTALDEQLWFFLKEDMNLPTFVQHQHTIADVRRNGIKLENILTILNVVTILVRGINEPSPNTSRSPSHQNSLRERRKISRGALVPEIFIQPAPRHASGTIDVSTMKEI